MRLLLALGTFAIIAAQLNQGRWVQLFPTGPNPSPRDWHTSAVIGGDIYVIGGSSEANVERFVPRTQSWSNLGDRTRLPGIQAADAAAAGGQLLAFGGKTDRQLNDLLSLKVGDPTATWKEVLTDDTIPERNGHSISIFAGVAIVFGGWNERQYFADLASLDLDFASRPRWQLSRATGGPRGRNSHTMVSFGDSLYLFGGFSHNISQGPWVGCSHPLDNCVWYSDVWRYSPHSDTWSAVPPPVVGEVPRGRARHSAQVIGESMYVFGGQTQTIPNSDELWQYHMRENRWALLRPLGERAPGRSAHAAAVSGGVLYVFGGTGAQSTTFAYYPPTFVAAEEEEKALIPQ